MSFARNTQTFGVNQLRLIFPGQPKPYFTGLDLSYQQGEKILIVGANGCGKSTLLEVLAGLIPKHIGIPAKWDCLAVPEHLAFCLQDPESQISMPYTDEEIAFVLENRCTPRAKMPQRIKELLQRVGLEIRDLHTPVNQLSGGNKQKLQLAALLAMESDVLFLDEPTAMLDYAATCNFWQQIKTHFSQKTLVIIEHRLTYVLDLATRLIVLNQQGQILADGAPTEVFSRFRDYLDDAGIWHPLSWQGHRQNTHSLPTTIPSSPKTTILELENFHVYRGKQKIVSTTSLTASTTDWICIIGKNGAGKSTLLQGIMGLEKTSGACKLSVEAGFVFQNPEYQFVTNKVGDELVYSLQNTGMTEAQIKSLETEFLARFQLQPLIDKHPFTLSMGEKRRLSVATALINKPRLLLLDEPTFGLDAVNTFSLLEQLKDLQQQGTCILMICHDPCIVHDYATRVWLVEQGQVLEMTPSEQQEHILLDEMLITGEMFQS